MCFYIEVIYFIKMRYSELNQKLVDELALYHTCWQNNLLSCRFFDVNQDKSDICETTRFIFSADFGEVALTTFFWQNGRYSVKILFYFASYFVFQSKGSHNMLNLRLYLAALF